MKILTIHFCYLRNETHYRFLLLVKNLFEAHPTVANLVNALLLQFYALLALEGKFVDIVRASDYTKQLDEIDKRLNRAVSRLNIVIEAAFRYLNPNAVKIAECLKIRMKAFHDEVKRKAYKEKTAAVKILVADLQGAYAPQVSALGLSIWVTEIAAAQAAFEQIFLLRSAEQVARPQGNLKDLRKEIEAIYRRITKYIDAYTVLNGTGVTGVFVSELNDEITCFNEQKCNRCVRKAINLVTVAAIPDQIWDGQPVTPLPVVTDENGNELVFGRDYELTYHNNDHPGNATVTLHGKGAWKNKKTVSFDVYDEIT
jgi:hypothetical protein